VRIWKRLYKHCDELFTFLDDPAVPADHNGTERDIRSLAAARSDGGTHRADWSAAAFARLKSVIVTGMKNQVRFIRYGTEVVRAELRGERLPLPLTAARTPANLGRPSAGLGLGTLSVPQTRSTTPAPPTRRGYDDRTRKERSNIGEGSTSERAAA
jgi:hypothetical protein